MLSQQRLVFLLGCSDSIQFLIPFFHFMLLTVIPYLSVSQCHVYNFVLSFPCLKQSVRLPLAPYYFLCSICVTYMML